LLGTSKAVETKFGAAHRDIIQVAIILPLALPTGVQKSDGMKRGFGKKRLRFC
jgi:hypothetical protein